VSISGFYAWCKRPAVSQRSSANEQLLVHVKAIHEASRGTYGRPRLLHALRAANKRCSSERLRRLMLQHDIKSTHRRKYRVTTNSKHNMPIKKNILQRNFTAAAVNLVWVADTTFLATLQGWLYLAVIIDVSSRVVVGWSTSRYNATPLTLEALKMAVGRRKIAPGLVHHSDQGSTYASHAYQDALQSQGITCSMSRKGDCWDNAMAESFFHTLKVELTRDVPFVDRQTAHSAVFEYIEVFYNRQRSHSALGFVSPYVYETQQARLLK
jgi:transposase InsO family protein